jgi:uncharacterized protein (DUF1684 family)
MYDTIKGGPGAGEDELVLDFNYAYNSIVRLRRRWICPLRGRIGCRLR